MRYISGSLDEIFSQCICPWDFVSLSYLRVFLLLPYRLIEAKDVVFECGPLCGCGPSCVNRTSQRGLKYRLEVVYIIANYLK